MAYTNGTTNYDLPQYVGSDVPDWADTNEPFAALDAAVGGATSGVTALGTRMTTAEGNISQLQTDVVSAQTTANGAVSGLATANEAITLLQNTVSTQGTTIETKFNSVAIADAYSGSSTYSVGDVVTYNGNRYKCHTAVTTGEPFDADKWTAEDVETVLSELNSNLNDRSYAVIHEAATNQTWSAQLAELESYYDALDNYKKRHAKVFLSDGRMLNINDTVTKQFSSVRTSSTGYIIISISLQSHEAYANANGSVTNLGALTATTSITLYA